MNDFIFFAVRPHLNCSFKPMWDYKNVWKLWNCFINGMSKNAKHRRVMCYYTLVCTRKQCTASSLHLALMRIKLTIKFTSSTSLLEKVASVSCRQLKSIRSRTRTTITLSTVLFLLYNFWECFHWGAHGKKIGVHRIWAVLLFCCWKTCTGRLLAGTWLG